jgi:hypothetical protein
VASTPAEIVRFIGRSSRRIAITLVGGLLVAAGLVMLVLPGPGIIVIAIGFAVLGTEYAWAAAALERTKKAAERAGRVAKEGATKAARASWSGARTVGRKVTRR